MAGEPEQIALIIRSPACRAQSGPPRPLPVRVRITALFTGIDLDL